MNFAYSLCPPDRYWPDLIWSQPKLRYWPTAYWRLRRMGIGNFYGVVTPSEPRGWRTGKLLLLRPKGSLLILIEIREYH